MRWNGDRGIAAAVGDSLLAIDTDSLSTGIQLQTKVN
jgi:hypothetical protein